MKIVCPLDNKEEVLDLINAGADEFYCGYISEDLINNFSSQGSLNRREWAGCNFNSLEDLKQAADLCKDNKKPIFYCLNASNISAEQYPFIIKDIENIKKLNFGSIIVSDIALIIKLNSLGIKNFHSSCGTATLNTCTIKFLKNLGAARIILPRQLSIYEIKEIRKSCPDIEIEPFVLNDSCKNLDGLCNYMHGFKKDNKCETLACNMHYEVEIKSNITNQRRIRSTTRTIKQRIHSKKTICGACAIFDFLHMGIDAIKIAGRGKITESKIKDIKFIKQSIELAKKTQTKKEFITQTKLNFSKSYSFHCNEEMCYNET